MSYRDKPQWWELILQLLGLLMLVILLLLVQTCSRLDYAPAIEHLAHDAANKKPSR